MPRTEFITRTITAAFIGAFTLSTVCLSPYSFLAFLCIINFFCVQEFFNLKKYPVPKSLKWSVTVDSTIILAISGMVMLVYHNVIVAVLVIGVYAIFQIVLIYYQEKSLQTALQEDLDSAQSIHYITIALSFGLMFLTSPYRYPLILIPIVLIWINDIGAYVIGKNFGKHKIAPSISPGKSYEGTIGGLVFTLLAAYGMSFIWPEVKDTYLWYLGILVSPAALAGDLYESSLKRAAGVKDSGTILPGHGGFLDRYDSFLFVLPVAALGYFIFAP